jgi:predicted dehydrogenase
MTPPNTFTTERKREKLRFGLVGAGAIAQAYLQAFENCDEARVVAVTDPRAEAAHSAAQRMRCASYDRVERMVEDCPLDAAIVCTPPVTHPDICVHLAEHGIHVLCEKPFSIDQDSAQRMLDAAQKAGVKLTMASKFRFVEDVVQARSMVASGVLGDLVLFENVFASRVDMASRWNSRPEISGGGVLIDNGTHSVDLMRYFLGPLSDVHALEGHRSQGLTVDETVTLFVRSVSGVICSIDLSWSITKQRESYLDIYGSRGAISVGWKKSSYLDFSFGKWVSFGHGYNKVQAFRSQIENFSRAIRGEESLLLCGEDAMASVSIIESAYKALRQNQWIPVSGAASMQSGNRPVVN